MARYIIKPGQSREGTKAYKEGASYLHVSELFTDAFQGEGAYAGCPSIFLRLAGCPLGCDWCDSKDIWNKSQTFSIRELVDLFVKEGLGAKLDQGFHLVITGGSPLLQQNSLVDFLFTLQSELVHKPFVEIENEVSLEVLPDNYPLFMLVDCWNNSPKLASSGVKEDKRYKPKALLQASLKPLESWFKFVVKDESDWKEIEDKYLKTGLIQKRQIILMPEGQTQEQLSIEVKRRVAELAVKKGVRFSTRLQIDIYNNKKGV